MANEDRISDSSSSAPSKYQVFLSFRGPDTRQGFTDILFEYLRDAGIRVFRDNNELRVGRAIGDALMQAMDESQIYVPIFSKTYADSKWCLRELAKMVEMTRKSKDVKEIIPVFCGVTVDDVKREDGLYDVAVNAHADGEDGETVELWKEALRGVCKIKGWELKDEGHAKFCKPIVREISIKLRVKHKQVTNCLVGMDDQVKALINLLDLEYDGVKAVGIHGMGGIGKTTLAKVVFNQLSASFDACSFISDVREQSDSKGLVYLQKKLLKDLGDSVDIDDEDDGINYIIAMSHMKRALVVLDDVSHRKQIEKLAGESSWFGAGSRIIITTRDKRNLEIKGQEMKSFEKEELDDEQALELFSLHTFGENTPPKDYLPLSKEVISFTGRLPLALEIIGSLLSGICEKDFWRNKIKELKAIPLEDVQTKLMISYNSLDSREKEIFLDIACLFEGESRTYQFYMWDACGFFPKAKVDVLVAMSLIKIEDNEFRMHDQVKDLGREIVRAQNVEYPNKRSRIWEENEAFRILKCLKKGRGKIKAIRLHDDPFPDKDYIFTHEDLRDMENLRFLELPICAQIAGDLQDSLPNLIWFRLRTCNSIMEATNFSMKRLVILELTGSDVSECWDGWGQLKMMDSLKVLDLSGSKSLTKTPDLSGCKGLERLILQGCGNLVLIHHSIGNLKALKYLDCRHCSLRGLPEEIGYLEELEEIYIEGFYQSFNLPESIGNLKSLKILKLEQLRISKLPHSIGDLKLLVELSLQCTNVTELPETIGGLVNLELLNLGCCSQLASLPESVQNSKSLVELNLKGSGITNIPECIGLVRLSIYQASSIPASLGLMESLAELDLEGAQVTELPDFIGNLKLLKVLDISLSWIRKLPSSIQKLKLLEEIRAFRSKLREIPMEIGRLPRLRILLLQETRIRGLPSEICQLPCLSELYIGGCDKLQQLPEQLPSSLKKLKIDCKSLKELPDLSDCTNLVDLRLEGCQLECSKIDWIWRCSRLESVCLKIPKLTHLPSGIRATALELDCPVLEHFPKAVIGLRSLTLHQSRHIIDFLDAEKLESLTDLSIYNCHSLEKLAPFSKLRCLERFSIRDSDEFGDSEFLFLKEWKFLKELTIDGCGSLKRLCDFGKTLEVVEIYRCINLKEIHLPEEMTSLKSLKIGFCASLERLIGLSKLERLKDIEIKLCGELREGISSDMLESLKHCRIYGCKHLEHSLPYQLKKKGAYRTDKGRYSYSSPNYESELWEYTYRIYT